VVDDSTPRLVSWNSIQSGYEWEGLLLGNGASIALWDGFAYKSLYKEAISGRIDHPLSDTDREIFGSLGSTTNFERVLGAIGTAKMVATALGHPTRELTLRYKSVQRALIEAVTSTHVPWTLVPSRTLTKVRRALEFFEYVFTTNYDLLTYWAVMSKDRGAGFLDYFLYGDFSEAQDWDWAKERTKILYLHGGIHLYRRFGGGTFKRKAFAGNLLDLFARRPLPNSVPLFISEGSYRDKVAAIHRNDYLSFALDRLASYRGRLVIFGSSLDRPDRHLASAINGAKGRKVAVGLRRETPEKIIRQKAHYRHEFPELELSFFDATSHPLGDVSLKIPDPDS
jgi:hypothetical protein